MSVERASPCEPAPAAEREPARRLTWLMHVTAPACPHRRQNALAGVRAPPPMLCAPPARCPQLGRSDGQRSSAS
eukprot:359619-Chlamydomonas_euryale.AAC.9